jgi:nitroimidazol reductase NimA-like FMN-containing flavoprotein (pyridoxamine 5'-phosphate oxidase superfamily)
MDADDTADQSAMEEISREECLQLLASQVIGRVAVADFNAPPLVVPVNFVVDRDRVVFRTDAGTKFWRAVLREQPVSFEIDGVDPGRRTGWSVLVQGGAIEIDPDEMRTRGPWPWAPGRKDRWIAIVPTAITGRRLRLLERTDGDRGYL